MFIEMLVGFEKERNERKSLKELHSKDSAMYVGGGETRISLFLSLSLSSSKGQSL